MRDFVLVALLPIVSMVSGAVGAWEGPDEAPSDEDVALIQAIQDNDIAAATQALDDGASPVAWTGERIELMAICNATRPGHEAILQLLLDRGADPGHLYVPAPSVYTAPLACATYFGNRVAFDLLLEAGAQLDLMLCPSCEDPRDGLTLLNTASVTREYSIMMTILNSTQPTARGLNSVIYTIERKRPPDSPAEQRDRQAVIAWLRANGHEVTPYEER